MEGDQDLSRTVTILSAYGQKYVDQLAKAYVAFNDKAFLPIILNMVIASARKDADKGAFGSREETVGPTGQADLARLQSCDFQTLSSPTVARKPATDSRERKNSDLTAAGPQLTEPPAPTIDLSNPARRSSVQPRVAEPVDEIDHLKNLFDRLTTSPRARSG